MSFKKYLYLGLGLVSLGLGAAGAALPILPSFPFLLLSAFCFGKSSQKLNTWFKGTNLYKRNLESYVKGQGMTLNTKLKILASVTVLIGASLFFMWHVIAMRIVLSIVWLAHVIYFIFGVKTKRRNYEE